MSVSINHESRATLRALLLSASALASATFGESAQAQSAPPSRSQLDENGIDLALGRQVLITEDVGIGPAGAGHLGLQRQWASGNASSTLGPAAGNYLGLYLTAIGSTYSAYVWTANGMETKTFSLSGTTYTSLLGDGSTLVQVGNTWVLTLSNGTQVTYGYTTLTTGDTAKALASQINFGNGEVIQITYKRLKYCANYGEPCTNNQYLYVVRPQGVINSFGYILHFNYLLDSPSGPGDGIAAATITSVVASNQAVEYCSPSANSCTYSNTWPIVTYTTTTGAGNSYPYKATRTDALGKTTTYVFNSSSFTVQPPAASSPTFVTNYGSISLSSINKNGQTWTYSFSTSANLVTATVTDPHAGIKTTVSDTNVGLPISYTDPLTNKTTYTYDSYGRLINVLSPQGKNIHYNMDNRGNIVTVTISPNTGSPLAAVTLTSGYSSTCAYAVTCNQPNWTKDALGNETDYIYDSNSGFVTSVTGPAAATGGIRPQTRISYSILQAYYKNSAGSIVASGQASYLQTATSQCRTQAGATVIGQPGVGPFTLSGSAACAGTADETQTIISYGPQTAGTPNNLLPVFQTIAAGDGSVSATTSQTYDNIGNVATTVGPLGAGQTSYAYYDANRNLVGNVTPDPDGAGPRTPAAVKYTYNADGVLTQAQIGTVPDQTANSFNNSFTEAYHSALTLDTYDRTTRVAVVSGGTSYAVSDQLYDSLGRAWCSVQYMNMAAVPGSVATSCAPSQTTGPYGPDRVVQSSFDADSRVLSTSDSIGVLGTVTYSPNGDQLTALDGQNNLTSYTYDGFDRLSQTNFPVATQGGNASDPNNYELLTYDAGSRLTNRRLRSGVNIVFTFDNLNRLLTLDHTDNNSTVTYSYNLINQLTQLSRSNGGVNTNSYDALGRLVTEAQQFGSASYLYDAAGNRTRITWGDGFYAGYAYDMIGNVTSINENGATAGVGVLATYGYDNLGRRTSVAYGNGTGRAYAYDPVGRLAGLQLTFPASPGYNELIGGVGGSGTPINYNPASQIAGITRSNDAYAWTGGYNVNRAYTTNGLNQLTSSGATTLGYDAQGNLNLSGTMSYGYDALNRLCCLASGETISHDPANRVVEFYVNAGSLTNLYYAGPALIAEWTTGPITNRYVPGPGTDEPIVWYQGSGTAARYFLQGDERGSIIAVSNSAGAVTNVNTYDEFGIPAATNVGRYQYTGQTWSPDVGLYWYKARWYSPTLGRFMQTDPIGYGDGLNMYNYVRSDPINSTDPTGLLQTCTTTTTFTRFTITFADGTSSVTDIYGPASASTSCTDPGLDSAPLNESGRNDSNNEIVVPAKRKPKPGPQPGSGLSLLDQLQRTQPAGFGCLGNIGSDTAVGLGLDAVGVAASLVGLKAAYTAGSTLTGMVAGMSSMALSASTGDGGGYGRAGLGTALTYAGSFEGASRLATNIPVVGAVAAVGVTGLDAYKALKKAGCL